MGGSSKKQTVGYWYKLLYHAGLSKGPIDAFLEFRGGDKTAWKGELTASATITIDEPKLWGGEKDQGGIVSDVDVMFGEAAQAANAYLLANLGPQVPAWRGLATLVFKGGRYGAMNPYPQKASYKIRKILQGWDGAAWYPETAEITMASGGLNMEIGPLSDGWSYKIVANGSPDDYSAEDYDHSAWAVGASPFASATGHPYAPAGGWPNAVGTTWPLVSTLWVRRVFSLSSVEDLAMTIFVDNWATVWVNGVLVLPRVGDGDVPSVEAFEHAFTVPASILHVGDNVIALKAEDEETYSYAAFRVDSAPSDFLGMNPAHILYYARSNADMGREPTANINTASLTAAADTLFAEGFGVCTSYDPAQESVEEFEGRITKLIDGSFSRDPITGQWYLDLARGDYVLDDLPILTDDDILEFREQPSTLDNAINSVSITYFDPERKETITTPPVQARALIQDFGTIHQTIDYPEIPTATLAARVAERELRATATPTRAFELVCTRKPYAWRPNTYFRLQVPKRGIADMVCIVGEKQSGSLKSGAIRLKAAQDIYSMPAASFVEVEPGVDTSPSPVPVPISQQAAFEAPYIELVANLSRADLDVLPDDAAYLLAVAADPAASRDYTMMVDAGGGYLETATGDWAPTATVVEAASWLDTAFTLAGGSRLDEVVVGSAALWDNELVRVDAIDPGAGTVTLARGCADTLPAEHAAGARIWFWQDNEALDPTEYTAGEALDIKLLTNTHSQQLDIALATAMTVGVGGRAALPYPPANVQINGSHYPASIGTSDLITITWAHRDRILQADQLVDWTQGDIGPEPGVTYTIWLYDEMGTLRRTETGLTGTTYTWVTEGEDSGLGGTPLWSSDGSSLAGWTVNGALVDNSKGQPLPSLAAPGTKYAYIAPVAGLVGKSILADVRIATEAANDLCNFFFGCNASGAGQMLRFDARPGQHSGIATTTSWTAWGGPGATGLVIPAGQWFSVRIDIKAGPVADWYHNDVLIESDVPIALNGDYIAIHGDGAVSGGNYDNLRILDTSSIGRLNDQVRVEIASVRGAYGSLHFSHTVDRVPPPSGA